MLGDPEPRFGSVQHCSGKAGTRAGPWLAGAPLLRLSLGREGVCWVSAPQDKQQDPNAPLFSRLGKARRCCTQPGACAGVQNFLPIRTAPLSETLVDPVWVRRVDTAKAAVNMGQ